MVGQRKLQTTVLRFKKSEYWVPGATGATCARERAREREKQRERDREKVKERERERRERERETERCARWK